MKKISAILVLLVLAFFIYQYFGGEAIKEKFTGKKTGSSQGGGTSGGSGGTDAEETKEVYGPVLRKAQGSIFSELGTEYPDPIPGMRTLAERAKSAIRSEAKDAEAGKIALQICSLLAKAHDERASLQERFKDAQSKNFESIDGDAGGAQRRKEFFLNNLRQNWQNYISEHRPVTERLLKQLQVLETGSSGSLLSQAGGSGANSTDPAANVYGPTLARIHAAVFAELKPEEPDPIAGMRELADRARSSIRANGKDAEAATLALKICSLLARANGERSSFRERLASTLAKEFQSIDGDGAQRQKDFFLKTLRQNWEKYATEQRPVTERMLAQLRGMEAQ